jgi:hypothetical protein
MFHLKIQSCLHRYFTGHKIQTCEKLKKKFKIWKIRIFASDTQKMNRPVPKRRQNLRFENNPRSAQHSAA